MINGTEYNKKTSEPPGMWKPNKEREKRRKYSIRDNYLQPRSNYINSNMHSGRAKDVAENVTTWRYNTSFFVQAVRFHGVQSSQ